MNALAAYGSDSEDSGSESTPVSTTPRAQAQGAVSTSKSGGDSKITSLANMLPPPKSQSSSSSSSNNNISASKKVSSTPTASISSIPKTSIYHTLPTLGPDSDSEEEESEFRKKAKLAEKAKNAGSGVNALFAMLPAPKGSTSSLSSSASGSGKPASAKPSFMPRTIKKPTPVVKKPVVAAADEEKEDDDDEDEEPVSFFPLGSAVTAVPASSTAGKTASNSYIPLFFDKKPLTTEERQAQNQESVDVSITNEQYAYPTNDQYAYDEQYAYATNDQYAYQTNDAYAAYGTDAYAHQGYGSQTESASSSTNTMAIDDAGLQKLGMRKAKDVPINIIDVSARDQMRHAQHARLSMTGSGTQAKPVDLGSIEHLKPTVGQKRKHNIMSLAYQAKANQQQLNASWAASRQTKAETQSKYGF
ncbi:hypothetical protein BGX21_010252 [Mortierella sp. AD011]|nr:hypothetical protein BGX20_007047 [Mortierella sp. AD010]KAF9402389.1 hypothetical protein BGX21_010252 [Mortierella sp. AD011]